MSLLRQNVSFGNEPILLIHAEVLNADAPDCFIYGHRIEQQHAEGHWQALSENEDDYPLSCVRVLLRNGDLVRLTTSEAGDESSRAPRMARDEWMEETDAPARMERLPAGPFRFEGLLLTREQLLRLLPRLRPDLEGVLYPGQEDGEYHFWTVGGETAVWNEYPDCLVEIARQNRADGPNVLFRVSYEDPFRPGGQEALDLRTGYCVGYYRPVPGPLVLRAVDLPQLSAHWAVGVLYEVLSSEELVSANLKPGPHERF